MQYCKSVHAGDCSKVSAHPQNVVSRENVYILSHKQIRPTFPIEHSSLVNGMASSPIQSPSRLVVWSESVSGLGNADSNPVCCSPKAHLQPLPLVMGVKFLSFGHSQESAPLLLAQSGCV